MTAAQKKKAKKEKEESQGEKKLKKKLEALALAIFTALGVGLGQGAVEALKNPPAEVPSQSEPMNKERQIDQWTFPAPQKDLPTGDEPKQRLRFTYIDTKGEEQTVYTWVSMRGLVNSAYKIGAVDGKPVANLGIETADQIEINAQLHPSAPVINVSVAKSDLADRIANFHPSLSPKDLESVTHINIAPDDNPEKPSKA